MQANVLVRSVDKVFHLLTLCRGRTDVVKVASCLVNVDILPGDVASFARASREGDYRMAWALFESNGQSESAR